jgi:hypothetical protein
MLLPKTNQSAVAARWALRILQAAAVPEAIDPHRLELSAIHLGAAFPSMTPQMMQVSGDAMEYRSGVLVTFNSWGQTIMSSWFSQSNAYYVLQKNLTLTSCSFL